MSSETFCEAFLPHATERESSLPSTEMGDYDWIGITTSELNQVPYIPQQSNRSECLSCTSGSKSENSVAGNPAECKYDSNCSDNHARQGCTLKGKHKLVTCQSSTCSKTHIDISLPVCDAENSNKCVSFESKCTSSSRLPSSMLHVSQELESSEIDNSPQNLEPNSTVTVSSEVKSKNTTIKIDSCHDDRAVLDEITSCVGVPCDDSRNSDCSNCHHDCETDGSCGSAQDYCVDCCDVVFKDGIEYRAYGAEHHLNEIMELVGRDLSEPYSIYTYRYFVYNWPHLCIRVSLFAGV